MTTQRFILIIGCGRLGRILATRFSRLGDSVVVVDQDPSRFEQLSAEFSGFTVAGDAGELDVLRRADIEKANYLLATTGKDNLNLMVAQIALHVFKTPHVVARVYDPRRESIYHQLGIEVINPLQESAEAFIEALAESAHPVNTP
jgi:trk system potassium uptake protein TrkA